MSDKNIQKQTLKLSLFVSLMFVFAIFIMPPFYDLLCDITGLGGKVDLEQADPIADKRGSLKNNQSNTFENDADKRVVKLEFTSHASKSIPVHFKPESYQLELEVGQIHQTYYTALNQTSSDMVTQAIPSVAPAEASIYLKKTACFCFEQQKLEGDENKEMPIVFYIDPKLPKHIKQLTLSYTLYDITDKVAKNDL